MPETETRTPLEWLNFLLPKLNEQAREVTLFRNYYAGIHRIAYATQRFREIFSRYFPAAPDNWCQIVVDSSVERLGIQGFRFGGVDQPADQNAWNLWQASNLDRVSRIVHTEAVKCGKAFILVDPTTTPATITAEHPAEVYVHRAPGINGERLAAIKRWKGDDRHAYVILYLPDRVYRFRSRGVIRTMTGKPSYEPYGPSGPTDLDSEGGIPNPLGVVPMIPVENNPDMLDGGVSDLAVVIPIQDRVNKLCLDLDVGSEFHAAPQRWATGWEPPLDESGNPLPDTQVKAATSRFLAFADPDAKVGSLPPGDPQAYVQPIEMYVQHIAALSRTPPHYLLGKMANLSGDALKAAETGLVAKVVSKQDDFAESWEEAIGLATGQDATNAEVIWRDPESRTFSQLVDGVVKLRSELALPLEMGWEIIGLSPQQIERAKKLIGLPERDLRRVERERVEGRQPGQGDPGSGNNDPEREASEEGDRRDA